MTFTWRAGYFAAAVLMGALYSFAQQPTNLSPREQLQQYVTQLQANPSDDALRTKIIQLALTLQPAPAVPPEADELAGRAKYIFEHANSNDDLMKAADAFMKVSLLVPWVPDYYFDAAVAYEKANDPAKALSQYKWCLLAGPDSADAKAVREKVGALSYVLEQQQAAANAEQARRNAEAEAEREREQAAEQARERQEEQEQQRLANLDPLIRSLSGAAYRTEHHDSLGNRDITTWTVTSDRVSQEFQAYSGHYDGGNKLIVDRTYEYPINGRTFRVPVEDCDRFFAPQKPDCYVIGTISESEISWTAYVNGAIYSKEAHSGYQVLGVSGAKRVK